MSGRRAAALIAQQLRRAAAAESQAERAWRRHAGGQLRRYASQTPPAQSRGPVSYLSLGLTLATGAGLMYLYQREQERRLRELPTKKAVVAGQAALGGPFSLVDQAGRRFTDDDLRGAFSLLYFGFTHCPDICPEELEKVAQAVDLVEAATGGVALTPVFISVDPQRDSVAQVAQYVREFHPRMVGLTGTVEETTAAARAYRVYHSRAGSGDGGPSGSGGGKDDEDYLIDHSIITYLLDPDGKFITFYGRNYTAQEMADSLQRHVAAWRKDNPGWEPVAKRGGGGENSSSR